ncbi:MAG: TlpA family protein disulfide reductase [Pirellulales bacterium]|nr:TlpA family protein disulfide reductase [Pirellulales bacterium]
MAIFSVRASVPLFANKSWLAAFSVSALVSIAAQAQGADPPAVEKPECLFTDIFAIPAEANSYKALAEFVQEIDSLETGRLGEQEMLAHQRKVARTVVAVAEKALQLKLEEQQLERAVSLKLQALGILQELGEPRAEKFFSATIDKATQDKRPIVRAVGMKHFVQTGFTLWTTWDAEEQKSWIGKITNYMQQQEAGPSQVQMLMVVIDFLSGVRGEHFAKEMLVQLLPHFEKNSDEQLTAAILRMKGIARRLNLPGNKIHLSGKLLSGSELDWSAYRGKVVLVDFWATWCKPCRAEVPNLLKLYADYHDKGFDILGISLDVHPEDAVKYLEETNIPWETLYSEDPQQRVWEHPMAVHYGITGIPRAILVDRDGTVVHMNARGTILADQLRRILGEPVAKLPGQRDSMVQQVSNPPLSE